jgi:hypothetical protein
VVDGFGELKGSYGSVHRIPAGVALGTMGGAALVGLILALAHVYAYALVLPVVVLVVLAVVRFRVDPAERRRWLLVYERGLVERVPGPGGPTVRYIPFADVTGVVPDRGCPGRPALAVASEPPSTVRLGDLSPVSGLHATLDRHLPGVVPRPGTTPVLVVTAALAVLALVPFAVPVVRALDPDPAAGTAGTAGPASSVSPVPYSPPFSPPPPAPPSGPHAIDMPTGVAGFWSVCDGNFVPSAPAYTGPPPHPMWDRVPTYAEHEWRSSTPTAVQLVACHSATTGAKVRTCRYTLDGKPFVQTLHKVTWTTVIREAKTGRVVANTTFVAADERCKPIPEITYSSNGTASFGDDQSAEPTDEQAYANLGRYVLG